MVWLDKLLKPIPNNWAGWDKPAYMLMKIVKLYRLPRIALIIKFRGSKFLRITTFEEKISRIRCTRTLHAACQKLSLKCFREQLKIRDNLYGIKLPSTVTYIYILVFWHSICFISFINYLLHTRPFLQLNCTLTWAGECPEVSGDCFWPP